MPKFLKNLSNQAKLIKNLNFEEPNWFSFLKSKYALTRNKIININKSNYNVEYKEWNQGLNFVMFAKKLKTIILE